MLYVRRQKKYYEITKSMYGNFNFDPSNFNKWVSVFYCTALTVLETQIFDRIESFTLYLY